MNYASVKILNNVPVYNKNTNDHHLELLCCSDTTPFAFINHHFENHGRFALLKIKK